MAFSLEVFHTSIFMMRLYKRGIIILKMSVSSEQGVARVNMADHSSTSASSESQLQQRFVYKVVLTGGIYCYVYVQQNCMLAMYRSVPLYTCVWRAGPCAGKTTTLARLRVFFESLGWKVFVLCCVCLIAVKYPV